MENDKIFCPLVDFDISIDECMENKETKEACIPKEYKLKENWKDICQNCEYHQF